MRVIVHTEQRKREKRSSSGCSREQNNNHNGITRSGNYIPTTVGSLDPPERRFNLKGEMTYDVPECIWRKLI